MPAFDYPRHSPHFLACRRACRPIAQAHQEIVVGLSGGPDSLALVAALTIEGSEVEAIIIDHGLQENSAAIARSAARQAEYLQARPRIITVTVEEGSGTDGTEAEARRARYDALTSAAGKRPVAVAHTRNDQAETLLLTALRGHATGMLPQTGKILRPFLEVTREDTVGTCQELGLDYWEDPHNDDPAYRRVALRQAVLPLLDEINGGATAALAAAAAELAEDNALLAELAGEPTDDCTELAAQPAPLRRRRIAAWLRSHHLSVTKAVIGAVDKLVTTPGTAAAVAAGHAHGKRLDVRRIGGRLSLIRQE
ncbi:tRNA lysidine(34) synthetase TilS [Corynebacterium yudongzhengii]|uniref:tRNA(Ile)-lysidine synthase n=1 Tax=Corynebacterium yudongzhengii TaxID=2080740 RepID=A0A2U1T5V7_9CORY|nr:tRNA lysidine(34) synthetase TilS [Corynebacterium yudongzhengii]AWB82649.1 tRNA lysidine(34) synthetase TilS [Corynebacterium yudongzhengii]PWC01386.1 tRNA lysidine(34) synthetase TilS [Corynebacterium yudongzhengii]